MAPPAELLRHLGDKKIQKGGRLKRGQSCGNERELSAKLYLYDRIIDADRGDLADEAAEEIRHNRLECLILLLYSQLCNSSINSASATAHSLLSEELQALSPAVTDFLAEQIVQLVVSTSDDGLAASVEDCLLAITTDEGLSRIVRLASLASGYKSEEPQAIITTLRDIAGVADQAGVAAYYLLAQIYGDMKLAYEEMDCYGGWMISLAEVYGRSAADLAGLMCNQRNREMEGAIILGVKRRLDLLTASGAYSDVNGIVDEFSRAGYASQMALLKINESRSDGYQCKLITKDMIANEDTARSVLYDLLVNSTCKHACIILKEDYGTDVTRYPIDPGMKAESEILRSLPEYASVIGVSVIPRVIEEHVMEARKWIVCYDRARAMNAIAVGILSDGSHYSVVYSRALVFDTNINNQKDERWFDEAIRLLSEPFDQQKLESIRNTVARISEKLSPSGTAVKVIKV